MEKLVIFTVMSTIVRLISSQTDTPPQLAQLFQQTPSFEAFLKDNPQINQLLLANPELLNQMQINPNLVKQTQDHAQFLNEFLHEHADLPQIIKSNPNVYGFILKQVDHAVQTGQDKTIVIEMTAAEIQEAQKELQEAKQTFQAHSQNISSSVGAQTTANNSISEANRLNGLSRDELLAMLSKYQGVVSQSIKDLSHISISSSLLSSTNSPTQQLNSNSGLANNGLSSQSNGLGLNGQITNSLPSGDAALNAVTRDNIDLNNWEDLSRLRALYVAMYNTAPGNIMELQNFYTNILAKLNIRTRKQVDDFLGRFKTSSQSGGFQGSSYQLGSNGTGSSLGSGTSSYVSVERRPSFKERLMSCRMRKFCRRYPTSSSCRQQRETDASDGIIG